MTRREQGEPIVAALPRPQRQWLKAAGPNGPAVAMGHWWCHQYSQYSRGISRFPSPMSRLR
jgi:hypothetical protein